MTRSILAGLAAAVAMAVLTGTGCQSTGVGDPCTPEQEYDTSFLGFDPSEVSVEPSSYQCQTRLCLVNHFQGRVSCPYGSTVSDKASNTPSGSTFPGTKACKSGAAPSGCSSNPAQDWGCCAPGTGDPISGLNPTTCAFADTQHEAAVKPQCSSRTADLAVYCSCRCQNVNGKTDDGANYCTCPDGFSCTQLLSSAVPGNAGLTGGYCIKNGSEYNSVTSSCPGPTCDPMQGNCGSAQGVNGH